MVDISKASDYDLLLFEISKICGESLLKERGGKTITIEDARDFCWSMGIENDFRGVWLFRSGKWGGSDNKPPFVVLKRRVAESLFNAYKLNITASMMKGGMVSLREFGTFFLGKRAGRSYKLNGVARKALPIKVMKFRHCPTTKW